MEFLTDLKHFYAENLRAIKGDPIGCSADEIDALETKVGFTLPGAYREYLEWMGKDYQGAFVGSNLFLKDALSNTEYLPDLLAENEIEFKLPKDYLVFYGHQGYAASWFQLPKESEDPPCWFFSEGTSRSADEGENLPTLRGSFTDILMEVMIFNAGCIVQTTEFWRARMRITD